MKQCNEELRSKLHCEEQEVKELLGKVVKLEAENAAKDVKLGEKDVELAALRVELDVAVEELRKEKKNYEIANRERKELERDLKSVSEALDAANQKIGRQNDVYAQRVEKVVALLSPALVE